MSLYCIALISFISGVAMGQAPSQYLFLFGDSYTTTGFNASIQPQPSLQNPLGNPAYPGATYTGGENWVDIVIYNSSISGIVGYNYAVGGNFVNQTAAQPAGLAITTGTADFIDQENLFETTLDPSVGWTADNSIFIHYFGINDITTQFYNGRDTATAESILFPTDTDSYFTLLEKQYTLGVRKFITILVPPIYRAPVFDYGSSSSAPMIQSLTSTWNEHLRDGNSAFQSAHSDANAVIVDPTQTFTTILDNPTAYGAPNATCYSYDGQPCLWRDFIHTGFAINQAFGNLMADQIKGM